MDPGDIILRVVADDSQADVRALIGHGDGQAIGESPFNDIARHVKSAKKISILRVLGSPHS